MATFISDNQKFHIFSKSPVRANMELFQATNKSGHTVISEEVRTDDIPWFINVPDVNNPPSYVKDPRKNDIIFQGKFNSLGTAVLCKKWDGEKWVDGPNLKDDPILKNKNDDDVIQVHFENNIEYVSDTNNAGTTSDKQAAFVLKANGEMLTHFVSPTDKIYNGIPSNGYGLYLFLDSQLQSETDSNDSGYIANSYAGVIQFNKARSEAASKFKVITFEYIGGYLSKSLDKLEDDLKDYIDEEIKEHNEEFIAHKNNQNSEKHLSQSEVDSLTALTSADKISGIETATQYDYQAETDLDKALSSQISTPNASDETFKNVTVTLHLRDKVLQQSTMPVTSKAIYNHVHKQSVNIEKASDNVTVEEVTTNENERRKYTIAVDGYTTSETDNIVDDIYEKIQATADDINKNVVEHTSNNGIHITDTERTSWNNNEVVLQKHLNDQNSHVSEADRILWNKGGNTNITGDNFIISEKTDASWSLTLDKSLFENKVEALPSVYTGNNEAYINCYGFEYTSPSENIIFDKIEIKFAKNLDTLTKLTIGGAPEISAGEVENNICKITVAKVKTPTDAEIEIATSDYNTNISNEVDLSHFKFSKNIILEKGWNYRFYFYDKNDNLFAAPVIVNTLPIGDSLLPRNSVANRWLSERYDYWGAYNFKHNGLGIVANGLAVKLINDVQKHVNTQDIHITSEEREKWDAASRDVYKDFIVNNFEEENNNYGDTYGFIIDNNVIGTLRNIKVKCVDYNKVTTTYLKILDENNIIVGCSEENQIHGADKELSFNFNKVTLEKDKSYKAIFSSSKTLTQLDATAGCLRVNYEGDTSFTATSLYTPILNSNLEVISSPQTGLKSYAIVEFSYTTSAADLSNIVYEGHKTHVDDRVKHIFSDDYIHDDTEYNNTPLAVSSLGYGFMWKPEKSAHISSIDMVLHCSNGIFYYNPGNLENTILNAQSPVDVCLKVTDTANNKVIGTSKLIQIEPGEKNKRQSVITVPFETGEYVPCVKNKTYLITFHSSAAQETPDVALPIYPSIYEDELPPASDDYTIKKIIKDSNKTTHYTGSDITNETHNSSNQTPMWPIHLEKLCVKVTTYRYTHPELELIADAIGDIWEYLATIRNYISQS